MNFAGSRRKTMRKILVLSVSILILSAISTRAEDLLSHIRQAVEGRFPGAVITEVRQESWKGERMWEIEIKAIDGREWELIISKDGRIMEIEEEKGLPWVGGDLSIGAGAMVDSEIYKGCDDEIGPAFFLQYENGNFEIRTSDSIDIAYTFFQAGQMAVAVNGSVFFNAGYDVDDSTYLNGMDKLDTLYSAGLSAQWNLSDWEIGLEVMQDVSGEHDGQEIELTVGKTLTAGEFEFTPSLSLSWISSGMTDYFFGVSAREAHPDRRVYSPDSSYEAGLELMVQRPLFGNFTGVAIAGISTFGSEIKDSPIVDEDYSAQLILGIMYSF